MDYEQKDLFGYVPRERRRRGPREQVHNDYEGFTEKFKPKKTTDDCYTPPAVYDALLAYLGERGWLRGGERIVELMGDLPRIELFARQQSPGWDVWGNEVKSSLDMEYVP